MKDPIEDKLIVSMIEDDVRRKIMMAAHLYVRVMIVIGSVKDKEKLGNRETRSLIK